MKIVRAPDSSGIEPAENLQWVHARKLIPRAANPNVVFTPELRLLEHSMLTLGWVQPILISPSMIIIDGHHRWRLALDSQPIRDRWAEEVLCCTIDCTDAEALMMMIMMNRAKGTHVAVRLSDVVQELHEDLGVPVEEIMKGCGMDRDEVQLLLAGTLLKTRKLDQYKYSNAWIPIETRRQQAVEEGFEREEEA